MPRVINMFNKRTANACELLKELDADALMLLNESNMHYFCGFSPSEGVVIILKNGEGLHFVDSRYTEAAENHAKETGLKVIEIKSKFTDSVKELCLKSNIKSIAFEDESISLKAYNAYKEATGCEFTAIGNRLMKMRNIKSEQELELMKKANSIAEKSLTELLNHIKPGKTEKELQAYFDYLMLQNGSDGASFSTILLTGSHTSLPHGVPSNKEIKKGDFVLIDFGATYKGYHSDMTRTFAVGSATDEMKEAYNLVLKAQLAGIEALAPNKRCADVYKAAYDVLDEKNMAQYFRHSLGHGVGLDIHEGYNAGPNSTDVFEPGNITSVEPGIYLPDKFGIRIEDVCMVTESGNEDISQFPKEFTVL